MMNERRNWFQIHLSTAIVLMISASVFVGIPSYFLREVDATFHDLWVNFWYYPFLCAFVLFVIGGACERLIAWRGKRR